MSTTKAEVIDDMDARMTALIGASYTNLSATFKARLLDAIATGIVDYIGGGAGAVASVFGRTGTVTAQSGDYTASQVGADASGSAAAALASAEAYADAGDAAEASVRNSADATLAAAMTAEASARSAADTALAAPDYVVKTATGTLAAERVATDGTEITMDWSVAGVVKWLLAATAVVAGSYGSATQALSVTVDAKGRITGLSNVTITGVAPSAHASTHQNGGSDEVGQSTAAANKIPKADGSGKLDTWISAASGTVAGIMKIGAATGAQAWSTILDTLVSNGTPGSTGLALLLAGTASAARTTLGLVLGTNVQAWSTALDGLAALAANGSVTRTGAGTYASRTLTAGSGNVLVTQGDGVAGNPTIDLPSVGGDSGGTLLAVTNLKLRDGAAVAWATAGAWANGAALYLSGGTILAGTLPVASGGTAGTTAQAARANLAASAVKADYNYGDGSDGAVVMDGVNTFTWASLGGSTYTLTRNLRATTINISNTVIVKPAGFLMQSTGLCTNAGTIHANGANAVGQTGATGAAKSGYLQCLGNTGSNGKTTTSAGIAGGTANPNSVGGSGGAGGTAGGANTGGIGGAATGPALVSGGLQDQTFGSISRGLNDTTLISFLGGGGGGSGGCDITGGAATSGGGGAGATGVRCNFQSYDGTGGTISANGGTGAAGVSGGGGKASGGGGGGGGYVYLQSEYVIALGTFTANGGSKGLGAGGGGDGVDGNGGSVVKMAPP